MRLQTKEPLNRILTTSSSVKNNKYQETFRWLAGECKTMKLMVNKIRRGTQNQGICRALVHPCPVRALYSTYSIEKRFGGKSQTHLESFFQARCSQKILRR